MMQTLINYTLGRVSIMSLKSNIYKALKYSNDINAVVKGKIVKRSVRREAGSFVQRLFNKLFR